MKQFYANAGMSRGRKKKKKKKKYTAERSATAAQASQPIDLLHSSFSTVEENSMYY